MGYFSHEIMAEAQSVELLKLLRRMSHKKESEAIPFSTEFCARRIEQETGAPVKVEAIEFILNLHKKAACIGDDTDPFLIKVHHGKRAEWWAKDLWWVSRV